MITRRHIMLTSTAAALGAVSGVGASASASTSKTSPTRLYTDAVIDKFDLGQNGQLKSVIPANALQNMKAGLEWMNSMKGQSIICAIELQHSFFFDEILKEARPRVLFKGEHYSEGVNQGVVRHVLTELPSSYGIGEGLPNHGDWTDELIISLSRIASHEWKSGQPRRESLIKRRFNKTRLKAAAAPLSMATYVLEI